MNDAERQLWDNTTPEERRDLQLQPPHLRHGHVDDWRPDCWRCFWDGIRAIVWVRIRKLRRR